MWTLIHRGPIPRGHVNGDGVDRRKGSHRHVGLPWFRGQVDRSHAMTLRLSIDDQPDQDQTPVYGAAKG